MKGAAMRGHVLLGLVVVSIGVTACGGRTPSASVSSNPVTTSTPRIGPSSPSQSRFTTSASAGPLAFVGWARGAEIGDHDMAAATDDQLLGLGNTACDLVAQAPSFGWAVQQTVKLLDDTGADSAQVEVLLRESVTNLCPQYRGLLP
jgi:hypothetical protein